MIHGLVSKHEQAVTVLQQVQKLKNFKKSLENTFKLPDVQDPISGFLLGCC